MFEDWFKGWNRTNDVYKLLEHAIIKLRAKKRSKTPAIDREPSDSELHLKLNQLQQSMPFEFTQAYDRSLDSGRNRCGFQAISIMGAVLIARVISGLAAGHELSQTLHFARSMVCTLQAAPAEYLRALSPSLVQNLKGVALVLCHQSTAQKTTDDVSGLLQDVVTLFKCLRPPNDESIASIESLAIQLNAHSVLPALSHASPFTLGPLDEGDLWSADNLAVDFAAFLDACGQPCGGS